MGSNSQPSLRVDIPLAEIDVLLRARVHDFDVNSLLCAWANVGGDNDKGIGMDWVPYAFLGRISECL